MASSWLQGKLLVAFLIEAGLAAGERFSPGAAPYRRKRHRGLGRKTAFMAPLARQAVNPNLSLRTLEGK